MTTFERVSSLVASATVIATSIAMLVYACQDNWLAAIFFLLLGNLARTERNRMNLKGAILSEPITGYIAGAGHFSGGGPAGPNPCM